jgi:putative acetyltransferase
MDQMRFDIREDDLSGAETRSLLELHLSGMNASSPAGQVFALGLAALQAADVTAWSAWHAGAICGIGALKRIDADRGELKSMRTHPDHLRKGVASALLDHIIAEARGRGLRTLSLETGRGVPFEAAVALYRRRGFRDGAAFADYEPSLYNQFLHLIL